MEEITEKRDIINQKLNYLAHATNNANHRKLKCGLIKELTVLDNRAQKILSAKLVDGKLTLEKFEVSEVTKYKNKKGKILYPTGYVPIENEPAAFIGNETVLKEFNILKLMLASYPKVVSREKLIEKIWGYEYFGDTRVIDAHMKNIRKKIKKDYIKTIKGVGYVLEK